jgi:hypothetical protein
MSRGTHHSPAVRAAQARLTRTGRRSLEGMLCWLRLALLALVVAPLLAAPGTAESPLVAGVALLVASTFLGGALLRSLDRVLPGRDGRPVSALVRSAMAISLTLAVLAALTLGAVALAGLGTGPRQVAAAPLHTQRMPRPVPGLEDVHQVATTAQAHFAVKNDGTVWT